MEIEPKEVCIQSSFRTTTRILGQSSWNRSQRQANSSHNRDGPPRSVKDVQKLIGYMAALNHFISRLGEKGLPFFKLLKKTDKFEWTKEADESFKKLKAYLTSSPVLTPPKKYEDMMLYIAATSTVISTAIVVEREEEGRVYKVQRPVYYISEVLSK